MAAKQLTPYEQKLESGWTKDVGLTYHVSKNNIKLNTTSVIYNNVIIKYYQ